MGDRKTEKKTAPLVFISHDTKDADIAEKFGALLTAVSGGTLKFFRSSELIGGHGIEYGTDWFPTLIAKLNEAVDVACLLTENSLTRPWILFEAGVAKGKFNNTLIHGIAIGIELSKLQSSPFAQLQNCADKEEALTGLIMQLMKRVPNAEPNLETVKGCVQRFRAEVAPILEARGNSVSGEGKSQEVSSLKLFEEIKVMFSNLSGDMEVNSKLLEQIVASYPSYPFDLISPIKKSDVKDQSKKTRVAKDKKKGSKKRG